MHPKNWVQWNVQYIKAVNSCDRSTVVSFLDRIITKEGGFTKKRYIWNWIRGKDFYKICSFYVVQKVKDILNGSDSYQDDMDRIDCIIRMVMETEKRSNVRSSFVWNVTKQVPLLRADMLPYMSYERIHNILTKNKKIVHDDCLSPFIDIIYDLRVQVSKADSVIRDTIQIFTDTEGES